ncbi:hypothetical protein ACHAPA_010638 [Fusarium lateritium]
MEHTTDSRLLIKTHMHAYTIHGPLYQLQGVTEVALQIVSVLESECTSMPSPNEKQQEPQKGSKKEETSTKAEDSPSKEPESNTGVKENDALEPERVYAPMECCPACSLMEFLAKTSEN